MTHGREQLACAVYGVWMLWGPFERGRPAIKAEAPDPGGIVTL